MDSRFSTLLEYKWNTANSLIRESSRKQCSNISSGHNFIWTYLERFGEGLVDEDDRYQNGEAFLGEASDVANKETEVERDYQE